MGNINSVVRRRNSSGESDEKQQLPIRLSGTRTNEEYSLDKNPADGPMGPAIGRQGNDHKTPDADFFLIGTVNGDRLQNLANTHLSDNPVEPGRIPRRWTNLVKAVLGRGVTGVRDGDDGVIKANQMGGAEDGLFIPHIGIPRGSVIARAYKRTVDDAAPIPGIYVANPTRR